jgi:hypothetical protein
VKVSAVGGDKNAIVPATIFHGQLASEVRSRAGNSTDKSGTVEGGGVKGITEGWGGRTERG